MKSDAYIIKWLKAKNFDHGKAKAALKRVRLTEIIFNYGQTLSTLAWQVVAGIKAVSSYLDPTSRYPC